jgi:hypothetical protein
LKIPSFVGELLLADATSHILCNEYKKHVPVFEAGIAAGF